MRSPANAIPAHGMPERLPAGSPSADGLSDAALDACQLRWLDGALTPIGRLEGWYRFGLRKALGLRRRAMALVSRVLRIPAEPYGGRFRWTDAGGGTSAVGAPRHAGGDFRAGDLVEVRSLQEIVATLDKDGRHDGLRFLPPMEQYCGRRFRILKPVLRIFDERDRVMRAIRRAVILEGGICHGQGLRGREGCDRSCFFYWKEAWLKKIKE